MALAMKRFGNDQEKIKKAETAFTHCQGEGTLNAGLLVFILLFQKNNQYNRFFYFTVANVSDEQCGRAKAARKCILEHSDDVSF